MTRRRCYKEKENIQVGGGKKEECLKDHVKAIREEYSKDREGNKEKHFRDYEEG